MTVVDNTGASDYGPFAVAGYPTLDIAEGTANEIWGGADPYYHKTTDTIDKLKTSLVRKGAQWMLATALEQANPLGPVSVEPGGIAVPGEYALVQNYPNPFNPSTTIEYSIGGEGSRPEAEMGSDVGRVRLAVYDLLGREVGLLVDQQQGPGRYSVRFDAGSLSSGVYIYKLTAGAFVSARKMTVVR